MAVARINVPKAVQRVEIIEIRPLSRHTMVIGFRREKKVLGPGQRIITEFRQGLAFTGGK